MRLYFRLARKSLQSAEFGVFASPTTPRYSAEITTSADGGRYCGSRRRVTWRLRGRCSQRSRERESVAAPLAWPKIGPSWRRVRARARQRRSLLALLCANTSSADLAPGPCVVGTAFEPRLRRGPVRPACNFTAALMPATGFPADGCGGVSPMTALLPSGSAFWITAVFLRGLGCS